uniref:Uncharacterized protein n=1 Tax=Lepeophtheirus salmonis TaxID=72036 RepID=A0A0K2TH37_LEPSM
MTPCKAQTVFLH